MKPMKSKKTSRAAARPRRRTPAADYAAFTVVLEDLRAQFAVFGESLQEKASRSELYAVRDELRAEMHEMRGELRAEMHEMRGELRAEMHELRDEVRAALLDLSRRLPG
jgi:hypothetical protein